MSGINVRERLEREEKERLSKFASCSAESKGRAAPQEKCELRTEFQRDRDRVIHSKSFRRLKHKTQVFLSPEGDHYRTRLTHTLEVSQIGRTIAKALRLNEDLTEAIALAHDLGHTPFGHAGESVLNKLSPKGFRHNEQSLRVVDIIENDFSGLNLTYEVRDGIVGHTGKGKPETLEGKIIQFADRIAYVNHDIDDAIRAGILKESDIPKEISALLGETHSERINSLIRAIIDFSPEDDVRMEEKFLTAATDLRSFMFERVYKNPVAKKEEQKVDGILSMLYEFYYNNRENLPPEYLGREEKYGIEVIICDYIAGMSDRYAITCYNDFFVPKTWQY